jgi:asparagine synthetase B (glutamine-hydrolysing)
VRPFVCDHFVGEVVFGGEGGDEVFEGREELLDEPEFDAVFGVPHDAYHHDVEHSLVEMAAGDGEDVDVSVFVSAWRARHLKGWTLRI